MAHNFSIKPGDMIKLRRNANDEIFAGGQPAHATSHLVIFSYLRVGTTEEGIYFTDTFLDQDVPAGVGPYEGFTPHPSAYGAPTTCTTGADIPVGAEPVIAKSLKFILFCFCVSELFF